jgi:hypothetical protein
MGNAISFSYLFTISNLSPKAELYIIWLLLIGREIIKKPFFQPAAPSVPVGAR